MSKQEESNEYQQMLKRKLDMMAFVIEMSQGSADSLQMVSEEALEQLQAVAVENFNILSPSALARFNLSLLALTVCIRTMFNNPLYDTPALADQFRNHVSVLMANVKKVMHEDRT